MPLIKSTSNEARESNISELRRSGYPADQAVAIAYSTQRKAAGKKGKRPAKRPKK